VIVDLPVRNNVPLLALYTMRCGACSGDENYSFFSEHGVQSPVGALRLESRRLSNGVYEEPHLKTVSCICLR
jgi:hypothetical protein